MMLFNEPRDFASGKGNDGADVPPGAEIPSNSAVLPTEQVRLVICA